jgi:acetyl-CoA synthetase
MVPIGESYQSTYDAFKWTIPQYYNIAHDVCDRHAHDASKVALIHHTPQGVRLYTFKEVQTLANRLANTFISLGLKLGDKVSLYLSQHPVTAIAHVACWKAGLVSVPTSTLFGVDALEYRLRDSTARILITDLKNLQKALDAKALCPGLEKILVIDGNPGDGVLPLMETISKASSDFRTLALTPDTPAFINYTSGTTGLPKGTVQGHRSMIGHMPGLELLFDFFPQDGDLLWSPADWAWLAGLMDILMPAWFHGKPVLVFPMDGFDPERSLDMMGRHGVRNVLLTPTMLKLFRPVSHLVSRHNVRLRGIITGSEAVGRDLLTEMNAIFGVRINEGFGQTECNLVLGNCASLGYAKIGTLGVVMPGHVAAIVDDSGDPLADGEVGNLAFRRPDPVMMIEYWRNPTATAEKYCGDWLLTGDLACRDEEGFYTFIGRADDVIKSSGYRIGPGEIEGAILRHPAVEMVAVVGIPDPLRTESICAYVVTKPGIVADDALADEIKQSVRDRLAKHEYPREVRFVASLPMTTTGKIMRRELRQMAIRR